MPPLPLRGYVMYVWYVCMYVLRLVPYYLIVIMTVFCSQIGPNVSIGAGVTIKAGVRIKESIVLNNATINEHALVMHSVGKLYTTLTFSSPLSSIKDK
jgi:serine acetyltransferase